VLAPAGKKLMRVLHLYAGNLFGGIENVLLTLTRQRHLCPEMEPHFALCFEGRLSEQLRACGAALHRLGPTRLSRPWSVWRARVVLRQLLAAEHFDIAVVHSPWVHCLFARTVRKAHVPLAQWAHDFHTRGDLLGWWAARLRPDVLVCNSRATQRSHAPRFPGVPTTVVHCPVVASDVDRAGARRAMRAELHTDEDAVVIVTACRLERWKGHQNLLDALALLKDRSDWECWIVGGAQRPHEQVYLQELRHLGARLGLERRLRWLGQRRDVPVVLAAADIHCQPNTRPEPFGIAFVEALQAALPIVTTALGGACEIVTPACGRLVAPGQPIQLAAALREYLTSPRARRQAADAGPCRAAELCDPGQQMACLAQALTPALQHCSIIRDQCSVISTHDTDH
jgi:glycosyltransferase involved in cell wall biosynthesis